MRPAPGPTIMGAMSVSPEPSPLVTTPSHLAWLRTQVPLWQASGLLDAPTGAALLAQYRASRGFSVRRLFFALGGVFVGVGLIWLVAANLDSLSPGVRFGGVFGLWLAVLVGAEVLEARSAPVALVGSLRTVAALGGGAVIFQAAQSLQVPAWEPRLVGCWAVLALVLAYLRRARGPLLVGIAAGLGWLLWLAVDHVDLLGAVLLFSAVTVGTALLGLVHTHVLTHFADTWRHVAAGLALVVLFAAAVPGDAGNLGDVPWQLWLLAAALLAAGGVGVATIRPREALGSGEVLGSGLLLLVATGLAWWSSSSDPDHVAVLDVAHALVAVLAYLGLAVAVALLGALRDSTVLTALSTGALVVFTVFQAFGVFAPVIDGAWLFLVLGLVLLGTGVGFDRLRRVATRTVVEEEK